MHRTATRFKSPEATLSLCEGNYCNEAWVHPFGIMTSSGQTAMVKVGSPANDLCQGAAARVTKIVSPRVAPADTQVTYVYTITMQNYGTVVLTMSRIRDLLPGSFLYIGGSTSGTVTSADPNAVMFQGRQRLDWSFSPARQIQPGDTRTLVFKATA